MIVSRPEATGWYLIRRPFETPTYRFAKFYLAEEDPESLIAAFYVEKGVERGEAASSPKLRMTSEWHWNRTVNSLRSGTVARDLLAGANRAGAQPLLLFSCGFPDVVRALSPQNDYERFLVDSQGALARTGLRPDNSLLGVEPKDPGELIAAIESHPDRSWYWVDLLVGAALSRPVATPETVGRLFRPLLKYV